MSAPAAPKPLRYHLRFQVIPGPDVDGDARTLADFCVAHGVEEAVLFFAAEEWNNGLLSVAEEDRWFDAVRRTRSVLAAAGIACSLNPWMTVLHTDRGRTMPSDRPFRPMVAPTGETSRACASFADPVWQQYVHDLYGRFARLGFRVLWVEDDFRYHNHAPLPWGGGFEPEIVERFARKIGRTPSREEIVAAILQPGDPHPWRAIWMETWRDIQLDVARGIADSVATAAPGESRLGLMSSHPTSHSIEGRDWRRLFDALAIDGRVAHRPHFAAYSESPGAGRDYSILMLDLQRRFRPAGCEVAPEIENFPFTAWTKSDTQTWAEMALAMAFGSDALLLDLFPFSGNPASDEPAVGDLLDRSRPGLAWIAAHIPNEPKTKGVGILWKEDAAAHVRTVAGRSMHELDASPFGAGSLLLRYGVPMSADPQGLNGLFGSLAWAYTDGEIRDLLSGGLLLDGESAMILVARGFGEDIGVVSRGRVWRDDSPYALERTADPACGVRPGLLFNANTMPWLALLDPVGDATEWTRILTPAGERVGAGIIAHENARGGRIVTFAAPDPANLARSYHRQRIVQCAVAWIARESFSAAIVNGGPHLLPIHAVAGGREIVLVMNGSPDPARPRVRLPVAPRGPIAATLLAPLAEPSPADVAVEPAESGTDFVSRTAVPYHGILVLEW